MPENLEPPIVRGNHGRNTARPEFSGITRRISTTSHRTLGAENFADDPDVRVDIRPSNDVYYRFYGERYLLLHDDMLGVKGGESQAYMVPLLHVGFLIPIRVNQPIGDPFAQFAIVPVLCSLKKPRSEPYNSGTRPKASM